MASISGLSKLGLPKLSEKMDPEDARALRNYLYQMQEQHWTFGTESQVTDYSQSVIAYTGR